MPDLCSGNSRSDINRLEKLCTTFERVLYHNKFWKAGRPTIRSTNQGNNIRDQDWNMTVVTALCRSVDTLIPAIVSIKDMAIDDVALLIE